MIDDQTSLVDFLARLRRSLLIAGSCWLVSFLVMLGASSRLFHWVSGPVRQALPADRTLVFLSAAEPILAYLTLAAVAALTVSLPAVLWQVWRLAAPLSCRQTIGSGVVFVLVGYLCFLSGAWLGFDQVFPAIIRVLLQMGGGGADLDAMLSMGSYLGLALKMMLAFGLVSELPVVMILLSRLGVVDRRWFAAKRRHMIVVAFVFGAIITPGPDVLSQCSIAVPFVVLYEVGILGCGIFGRAGSARPRAVVG